MTSVSRPICTFSPSYKYRGLLSSSRAITLPCCHNASALISGALRCNRSPLGAPDKRHVTSGRRTGHHLAPRAADSASVGQNASHNEQMPEQPPLAAAVSSWGERTQRLKAQVLEAGSAGACTLVICNAAYFTIATLFVWFQILHVPRGIALASSGMYMGQAMGITYASCQATKLPRILGTLLLVPFMRKLLDWLTDGHGTACRSVFLAVLVSSLSVMFGSLGALTFLWTI